MNSDRRSLVIPILLIVLGSGWLLTTMGITPAIDWVWTLGLATAGILVFLVGGFDKVTFVLGTLMISASVLSVLRQTDRLHINNEIPILVILSGVLMLIARSSAIPIPSWYYEDKVPNKKN